MSQARAWHEKRNIPTYPLPEPDRYPMFFEKRVYQGSSGKAYPLAFHSRLDDTKADQPWDMWCLENEYVRIELLPELGGRIWRGLDVTNGYDFFYYQPVIKPALVGLAGPWISGGVEFNWPQHHRPATYLPCDVHHEQHDDGSTTVWMSDHDPMAHVKGMHGVSIAPGSSVVELKVRLYNRTPYVQTFLWWANVAAQVHDQYQSFFPPDVRYVADHAVRAMSSFPIARNHYYGVDYRPGTDLSWYKNIPVPTSYMITNTSYDFFGGYDHGANAGFVHVANRHISPGKKQWTWGNHEFGWAWDRELTEADEQGAYPPYVELMAGVYTDNQPDFSYLMPYETKTFSQYWWPIQKIGPLHNANREFGIRLDVDGTSARLGLCASSKQQGTIWQIRRGDAVVASGIVDFAPDAPAQIDVSLDQAWPAHELTVQVLQGDRVQLAYTPPQPEADVQIPPSATEPPLPADVPSNDELYLTGEHLLQYRHPTRDPDAYWTEAIKRDPGDARAHSALGQRWLGRGQLDTAETHLRSAVKRNTHRHPNPANGEPVYFLGLCLKLRGKLDEAYRWLYKATWSYAWRSAGYYQLATIDLLRGDTAAALEHLDAALVTNAQMNCAHTLKANVLRQLGQADRAAAICETLLADDPLDAWALYERSKATGQAMPGPIRLSIAIDVAFDLASAGLFDDAIQVLGQADEPRTLMARYTMCWLAGQLHGDDRAMEVLQREPAADDRWCFPDRLEEAPVLRYIIELDRADANACVALGNLHYDKRCYESALDAWQLALERDPNHVAALRNLGIGYMNVKRDPDKAIQCLARAHEIVPDDAQVLSEYDQLLKRVASPIDGRLGRLEAMPKVVAQRDDLSIERIALLNLHGQYDEAARALAGRRFHPWEGGEGKAMAQHVAAHLGLARRAIDRGEFDQAINLANRAMSNPPNLGEAKHLLANTADIQFHRGVARLLAGHHEQGRADLDAAAACEGDFLEMAVQSYSDKSFFSGMAMRWLGRTDEAGKHFNAMLEFGQQLQTTPAKIDYFATSLPDLLVFDDDLQKRREIEGRVIVALAQVGLEQPRQAIEQFKRVVAMDPSHAVARMMLEHVDAGQGERNVLWCTQPTIPG